MRVDGRGDLILAKQVEALFAKRTSVPFHHCKSLPLYQAELWAHCPTVLFKKKDFLNIPMLEVECKILNVKGAEIERKLRKLGGKRIGAKTLRAMHFDTPGRDFKKNKWLLRLRTDGKEHILTMKTGMKCASGIKSAEEKEITVANYANAKKILMNMGFGVVGEFVKKRISYRLGKAKIEIDRYGGELSFIPTFLEIEATSRSIVLNIARKLGYTAKDLKPWTVYELIGYYKGRKL